MSDDLAQRVHNLHRALAAGDIDEDAYARGLVRLRATYGTTRLDALLGQWPVADPPGGIKVNISTKSGSISSAPVIVVGHANHVTFLPAPDPTLACEERALQAYLQRLVGECRALPLGQIDPTDADRSRPVELARVYVGLRTTEQVQLSAEELAALPDERRQVAGRDAHPTRPLSALEALSRSAEARLMLLGAPGSGKSTFVSHLALCLAGANLRRAAEADPDGGWLARLPGWRYGPLLPIRLVLRDLAAFGPLSDATRGSVRVLETYILATLQEAGCPDALVPLTAALRDLVRCLSLAYTWGVPVVLWGGGTGNYGQVVPVGGGLIVEIRGLNRILEISDGFVRVEGGCLIGMLNEALHVTGLEQPIFPSTQDIATIGGFIAGGSGGIGSLRDGMLRDPGNIISITALSAKAEPQWHVFEGNAIELVHPAWGINGAIVELTLRTVPALDLTKIDELQGILGDDVLMHHEFSRLDGKLVAFDIPIVFYHSDERLYKIVALYEAHGCPVSDPHTCIIEDGGMQCANYRHLALKKQLDPKGLVNSAKSRK